MKKLIILLSVFLTCSTLPKDPNKVYILHEGKIFKEYSKREFDNILATHRMYADIVVAERESRFFVFTKKPVFITEESFTLPIKIEWKDGDLVVVKSMFFGFEVKRKDIDPHIRKKLIQEWEGKNFRAGLSP